MKIEKQLVMPVDGIYAVNSIVRDGKRYLLISTEKLGECWMVDPDTFEKELVWSGPGGTMAFAGTEDETKFLAIQNFFPVFDSSHAVVTRMFRYGEYWAGRNFVNMPYVHRIDVIKTDLGEFFVGCSLCSEKQFTDDWSSPGEILVGKISEDGFELMDRQILKDGLFKNHGYFRDTVNDPNHAYVGAENGMYRISAPTKEHPDWQMECLLEEPTSDMALIDIDGDGRQEILMIQPFHGDDITVCRIENGKKEVLWKYEGESNFGHVAWSGMILGKPAFIIGFRGGKKELVLATWKEDHMELTKIDEAGGPCNVFVYHDGAQEKILASNAAQKEAVLYTID